MKLIPRLIAAQRVPVLGRLAKEMLALYGVEFPKSVEYGERLNIVHRGFGVVVSPRCKMGNDVTIYHGVTMARADSWVPLRGAHFPGFHIGDHAVLCPGAKLLAQRGEVLRVGEGTIVAANSVLTRSTGDWEIWAGVPAKMLGSRTDRPDY